MMTAGSVQPRHGMTPYQAREGGPCFLSDMIIELRLAAEEHVEAAVETARSSGETVGRILVREGRLSEDQLAHALAARYGLNHIDLNEFEVNPDAANLLPPQAAERYKAVPVGFEPGGELLVAMADPSDSLALSDIAFMTRLEVQAAVAAADRIAELMGRLPLPPNESRGSTFPEPSAFTPTPSPTVSFAPEPVAPAPVEDPQLTALRAEVDQLGAALDGERSKHAQAVAELRQQLAGEDRLRGELDQLRAELDEARAAAAAAGENQRQLADVSEAERRVTEAHATLEKMRHDFELERETHAATERELRARLASETERHEALQEAQAALQKRVDVLRTQNAALLDAYATAKRWSAEFARGARELANTLEQPVLDDAVRAQQPAPEQQPPQPPAAPPADESRREGPSRFIREDEDDSPPRPDWLS
jgi:hypothetical protein